MTLINSIASWLMKKRMHQIELFLKYPLDVQRDTLIKLVKAAKDTSWGKEYGYTEIRDPEQFRKRIPLQDYNSLKPYIEKIKKGEQQILWPGEIRWFAKSSGTSGDKSKFIPLSTESLEECHFKGGKDMLSIYCSNFPETRLFTGKSLTLSGSLRNTGEWMRGFEGDLSALIVQNLPLLAELARTPSAEIALLENWEEKIDKIAQATASENVTSMAGVPSWMLLLLKHILHYHGKTNIHEVWPNLEVFFHGGVNFNPYQTHFDQIIDRSKVFYLETYNASEGFFGIQDQKTEKDLLLMLDYGIYYEFIPQGGEKNEKVIGLDEVKTGRDYAMVISTNAGLWRYQVGDTVRFTSIDPFRIKISGRTKMFINAFGEELMIHNAEDAIKIACDKTRSSVIEFTGGPWFDESKAGGAHEWIIEFDETPENPEYFKEVYDNALKSLNSDYEAKRFNDMILGPPRIHLAPKGTFYRWMKSQEKLGGQFKVPRLSNNRIILENILSLLS
jgi:hypothetical protein